MKKPEILLIARIYNFFDQFKKGLKMLNQKRIISLLLSIVMLSSMLTSCNTDYSHNHDTLDSITDPTTTKPDHTTSNNHIAMKPDHTTSNDEKVTVVWVVTTGSKYHSKSSCSNMKSPRQISLENAQKQGYEPCKKCY